MNIHHQNKAAAEVKLLSVPIESSLQLLTLFGVVNFNAHVPRSGCDRVLGPEIDSDILFLVFLLLVARQLLCSALSFGWDNRRKSEFTVCGFHIGGGMQAKTISNLFTWIYQ